MSREDYVKTMRWFHENHAELVPSGGDGFPAHWMLYDGSFFMLSTIEECESFAEVEQLVMQAVAA